MQQPFLCSVFAPINIISLCLGRLSEGFVTSHGLACKKKMGIPQSTRIGPPRIHIGVGLEEKSSKAVCSLFIQLTCYADL